MTLRQLALSKAVETIPVSRDGSNVAPQSFAQQRLWLFDRLAPGNALYAIAAAIRLRGALRLAVLERSIREIVRRHEALRTTFDERDGVPVQIVGDGANCRPSVVDLSALDERTRDRELTRLAQEDSERPFDLACGPMLRITVVRSSPHDHGLLLTVHHIVSDGWSIGILISELTRVYAAFAAGRPSPLEELPLQYRDYAVWQRKFIEGPAGAAQHAYWRERLKGDLPSLRLPVDRTRPATPTFRGATEAIQFPPRLAAAVRATTQHEGVTLFMLLVASLDALLYRYTGQTDILVGTGIANRNRVEIEGLIGFFVNMLALRVDLSGDPSVRQLIKRVRDVAVGAYVNQDFPFDHLVHEFAPTRDPGRNPLLQVVVELENVPAARRAATGFNMEGIRTEGRTASFDLSVLIAASGVGLGATIRYSTDVFSTAAIRRFLLHWQTLLEAMVANPDCRIGDLPLLTNAERRQILDEWNATATPLPSRRAHDMFEAQAAARPEAIAVAAGEHHITFGALNRRANQCARALQARGVGSEVRVGVWIDRSPELIVALVGILKAGGAYVPLDTTAPPARVGFMLQDAGVRILASATRMSDVPTAGERTLVRVDVDGPEIAISRDDDLGSNGDLDNLAYVIYTSGSTGRPKGVMIEHRGFANYLAWCIAAYDIAAGRGAPVHSSPSTDLTVTSLWGPLAAGARVVLTNEAAGVEGLADVLGREGGFSLLKVTPAHVQALSDQVTAAAASDCARAWVIGGEALHEEHVAWWRAHAPAARLINEYGPTETVVGCCVHESASPQSGLIPIGRPIANTRLYVLDRDGQPTPVGVTGELYIGGAGVARGYWQRPDMTAERFVPDRWSDQPGARLYRTGDLARYGPDGTLVFLGRRDQQVKLRGYRVELGEIEAVLRQCARVDDAVVALREEAPGQPQLVGYVRGEAPVTSLRSHLQSRLPEYMVPAAWVRVDALPLTANGKVDRARLPSASAERETPIEGDGPMPPRDLLEFELARLWAQCLGVDSDGVRDDFFESGGHSLRAIALMAAVKRRFGRGVPLQRFVERPTVEHLGILLRGSAAPLLAGACLVPIQSTGSKPPLFCAPPGGGSAIHYRNLARALGPEQPLYGLQAPGLEGEQEPFDNWTDLAAYYIEAIRRVQPHGPYFLGGWSDGARVALEMGQQLYAQGEDVRLLAIFDEDLEEIDASVIADDVDLLCAMVTSVLPISMQRLRELDGDGRLEYVLDLAKRANLVPPDYTLVHARRQFRVFKANAQARVKYKPRPYPGRVAVFWAGEKMRDNIETRSNEWRALALGGLEPFLVPGNHLTLMRRGNVHVTAEHLRACLEHAQQRT